jgi:hypothetical protein
MLLPNNVLISPSREWVSYTSLGVTADQIDGRLTSADGDSGDLDVWTAAAAAGDGIDGLQSAAQQAWDAGGVYVAEIGVRSLVVPHDAITAEILNEAIRRFCA